MATLHPYFGVSKRSGYKKEQVNRYNQANMKRYGLNVNKKTEKKIIKWIEENRPFQSAIKKLILDQIAREKKTKA